MRFRAELQDYYTAYNKDFSISEIANKIKNECSEIDLTYGTIRKYLYKIKSEHTEITYIDNTNSWKVIGDRYIFENKFKRKKSYTVDFIDKLFLHYSRNGYDFTGAQMIQEFDLSPRAWNEIKIIFMLQKNSDILSPHTLQTTNEEELDILRSQQLDLLIRSGKRARLKYQQKLERHYRNIVDKDNLNNDWLNEAYNIICDELPAIAEINITKNLTHTSDSICAVLADLHSGAKATKNSITEEWDVDMLEEKLDRVAQIINSYGSKKVTLYILGDLVETISGLNHPDTYKIIQNGWFGSNAIIGTYDILRRFISKIHNLVAIGGCGGNHDRLQASNKNGDTGATDIIFEFLKRHVEDSKIDLVVNYDPILVVHDFDDFGFIGVHGDKGLHTKNTEYLLYKYAINRDKYQFILSAHLHSFFCKKGDDTELARRITIPSIVAGNNFSDVEIGAKSNSGFVILKSNIFKEPTMIIENV